LYKNVTLPQRPVADHRGVYFQLLKAAIQEVWGPLPVLPALVCGELQKRGGKLLVTYHAHFMPHIRCILLLWLLCMRGWKNPKVKCAWHRGKD
jgi:hypothetical protein